MRLRHGQRRARVARAQLAQARQPARLRALGQRRARGVRAGVGVAAVPAAQARGVEHKAAVEEALTRNVVAQSDHPGRCRVGGQDIVEVRARDAGGDQPREERVPLAHPARQQVERQPAADVLVVGLVPEGPRGEGLSEVLRLHQRGTRPGLAADGAHREQHAAALEGDHAEEIRLRPRVRPPMAVEAREPRRGQRLVHGRPGVHPGVAAGDLGGLLGEALWQERVEQAGAHRAAAVVDEADDGIDAEAALLREALVVPAPIRAVAQARHHALPADRVAQGGEAEGAGGLEVGGAQRVAGVAELVAEPVAHADDAALEAAPHFGGAWGG